MNGICTHFAKKLTDQRRCQCKSGYWKNLDFLCVTKCKKYASFSCTLVISNNINVDDIFMYFSVAKATLESQMSVCHRNPSAPQKHAYQPNLNHVAIMPLSHHAPLLSAFQNYGYRPSCLSVIMPIQPSDLYPAFAT